MQILLIIVILGSFIGNFSSAKKLEKATVKHKDLVNLVDNLKNEEVDFIIARRVSIGSWDESYGMTSYKYFMKN